MNNEINLNANVKPIANTNADINLGLNEDINANLSANSNQNQANVQANEISEKDARKVKLLAGTVGLAVAFGLYTQLVNWNPAIRTLGHFFGAVGVPSYGSLATSFILGAHEEIVNFSIRRINKVKNRVNNVKNRVKEALKIEDKEKPEDKENNKGKEKLDGITKRYQISPETKRKISKGAAVIGSLGYMAFCASWESWQFAQSGVFQLPQYVADFGGPLVGALNIGVIESGPVLAKINEVEAKIKAKMRRGLKREKELTKEKPEVSMAMHTEKQAVSNEFEEKADAGKNLEKPVWDLSQYDIDENKLQNTLTEVGKNASEKLGETISDKSSLDENLDR